MNIKPASYQILLFVITCFLSGIAHAGFINFKTVKNYATLSALAYESPDTIRRVISAQGYKVTHISNIPEINIGYYLLANDETREQIIVVRGTSNIENAIIDASVKLVSDPVAGVLLHEGFSFSASRLYREVKPLLKHDYMVNTTGHSLGGAVASILAMYLHTDGFNNNMTITFGQPKITNVTGANRYSHLSILRVVTLKDMVPIVPPFDPTNINNINIYWHPGTELLLNVDNSYSTLTGIDSMLRAVNFTQSIPNEENLQNHQMRYYLQLINSKIKDAKEVPFKNSLNPLDWFF